MPDGPGPGTVGTGRQVRRHPCHPAETELTGCFNRQTGTVVISATAAGNTVLD